MSTEKRARQKANRASRVAAAEAAAGKAKVRQRMLAYGSLIVLVVIAIIGIAVVAAGGDDDNADTTDEPTPTTAPDPTATVADVPTTEAPAEGTAPEDECPEPDGSSPRYIDFTAPPPTCIEDGVTYTAVFDTSFGEVAVEMDTENTPVTANNFITLARWGYYDGTTIFRSNTGIDILQGGAPHTGTNSDPGPGYNLVDEPTMFDESIGQLVGVYEYEPGQIVMARTPAPDGASAQFFFTTGPNAALLGASSGAPGGGTYVPFGTTDDAGLGVLGDMIATHVDTGQPGEGEPGELVFIESVTIIES